MDKIEAFLATIELDRDEFIEGLKENERAKIMGMFAQSMLVTEYTIKSASVIPSGTVRITVDNVAKTIRDNQDLDTKIEASIKTAKILYN